MIRLRPGMFIYAAYPRDEYYHLLERSEATRTLCGLSTKGSRRDVREWRPPAAVGAAPPPGLRFCPLCDAEQERRESGGGHSSPPAPA